MRNQRFIKFFHRVPAIFILLAFTLNSGIVPTHYANAQRPVMPVSLVNLSPAFAPPLLKGLKIHPDNPFRIDFILDKGEVLSSAAELKMESTRLIKYFLAAVTVPEEDLWVNLSPYEKDRIIPEALGVTEMGRDLLAQDYLLKQITAALLYPEGETGQVFWEKVYAEAERRYGTMNMPVETFNKVWIVPAKAVVFENEQGAYIVESRLRVMLESDYVASEQEHESPGAGDHPEAPAHVRLGAAEESSLELAKNVLREVVIPVLEKEVNEGENFAPLRQVYHSLILAAWFKDKVKESSFGGAYVDKNKIGGVDIADKSEKEKIWQRLRRIL